MRRGSSGQRPRCRESRVLAHATSGLAQCSAHCWDIRGGWVGLEDLPSLGQCSRTRAEDSPARGKAHGSVTGAVWEQTSAPDAAEGTAEALLPVGSSSSPKHLFQVLRPRSVILFLVQRVTRASRQTVQRTEARACFSVC